MSGIIEAIYIYDDNRPILTHVYASRPLSANQLLPLYNAYTQPRPNLIYLSNTNPPTLVFSLTHSNLLFLLTTSSEIEPLLVLEFLHRVIDVLEEFVGSPLLAPKIESNYEIVAQLLNEMCDAGFISTTEPNGLRDLVEVEGWIGKVLGNFNIPGKPGFVGSSNTNNAGMGISPWSSSTTTQALPWRRANVRHTSNEIYVDIIETLSVTLAPSGRPLAAFANGTIALKSKISGVPEIRLNLSALSGKHNINNVIEYPVFHPCVRLARWKENLGEISFVPPDGKFVLAGYGVDLFPVENLQAEPLNYSTLKLPVNIEVKTGLGPTGSEFEIRLLVVKVSGQTSSKYNFSTHSSVTGGRVSAGFGKNPATSNSPLLQDLVVNIPLPKYVKNLPEIRASRGETTYTPGGQNISWEISAREAAAGGAILRCTAIGLPSQDESNFRGNDLDLDDSYSGYQEDAFQKSAAIFNANCSLAESSTEGKKQPFCDPHKISQNKILMPNSVIVSFTVEGWLASGIKVESLVVDSKKSRGLGDGVRPHKGVKYLTVSREGVEMRC